ncbi:MAG: septal ring lytic transglycosylase RlpA family protein, partial [Rhodospirillales bacterium]|nr:septal ring lytic transglycosylase RlpA family protein [Rhodospirillales bacterium]
MFPNTGQQWTISQRRQNGVLPPRLRYYKVGNPYQIKGLWYYPAIDYDYVEEGVASWYGPGFHGKTTANGETYDQNDMTAAHRTLPMPSIVTVTNLENGRSLKLRINDRGPFAYDRIIDVSRRGAQLLGFHRAGTTRVRVEIDAEESRQMALAMTGTEYPGGARVADRGNNQAIAPAPAPVAVIGASALEAAAEPQPQSVTASAVDTEQAFGGGTGEYISIPPPPRSVADTDVGDQSINGPIGATAPIAPPMIASNAPPPLPPAS